MMTAVDYRVHLRNRLMVANVPFHLWEGLVEYLSDRRPTGGFLQAVLSNDLTTACVRAHPEVRERIADIVMFLVNYAPSNAWGSEKNVAAWLASTEPVVPLVE